MGTDDGDAVLLLGIGDAHGDFAPLFAAVRQEPTACALLQVGDLTAGKAGREARQDDDPAALASLPLPLAWVHGNHEHWEYLVRVNPHAPSSPASVHGNHEHWEHLGLGLGDDPAGTLGSHDHREAGGTLGSHGDREAGARHVAADDHSSAPAGRPSAGRPLLGPGPPHHLWPGESYVVPGTDIRIVGLPGNYAPTWYEREKPFPGDRARHFNAADVQALERFQHPAVLLMHEAFRGQAPGRIGLMGIPVLAGLVRRLQPAVCLTGHHHAFAAAEHGPTLALALPRAQDGYVRLWFAPSGQRLRWEFVPLAPAL